MQTPGGGSLLAEGRREGTRGDFEPWFSEGSFKTAEAWGARLGRSLGSLQTHSHFEWLYLYLLCIFGFPENFR